MRLGKIKETLTIYGLNIRLKRGSQEKNEKMIYNSNSALYCTYSYTNKKDRFQDKIFTEKIRYLIVVI